MTNPYTLATHAVLFGGVFVLAVYAFTFACFIRIQRLRYIATLAGGVLFVMVAILGWVLFDRVSPIYLALIGCGEVQLAVGLRVFLKRSDEAQDFLGKIGWK